MMNRRSFLQSILLTATAPAIVRADSLMRIVPRDTKVITTLEGIIIHKGNIDFPLVEPNRVFWLGEAGLVYFPK